MRPHRPLSPLLPGCDPDERRVLRRAAEFPLGAIPRSRSLAEDFLAHLAGRTRARARYVAPTTLAVHARSLRVWLRFLAVEARSDAPDAATVAAFRAWAARLRRPATVNALLEAVRLLYRWAAQAGRGEAIGDGVEGVADPREAAAARPLSDREYAAALRCIAGDSLAALRDRALLATLRALPVDTIALVRADVGDLDLRRGSIRLVPRWGLSRWRRGAAAAAAEAYPLSPAAQVHLAVYLRARGDPAGGAPLFTALRSGRRMGALGMRLVVLRTLVAAGLRAPAHGLARHRAMYRYPSLTPHDLVALEPRLATAGDGGRLRAIAALLAIGEPLPLERLRLDEFDEAGHGLLRPARGARPGRRITIAALLWRALAPWLRRRRADPGAGGLCFADDEGRPLSHHALKRLAWSLVPERLPPQTPRQWMHATRRLRIAPTSPGGSAGRACKRPATMARP